MHLSPNTRQPSKHRKMKCILLINQGRAFYVLKWQNLFLPNQDESLFQKLRNILSCFALCMCDFDFGALLLAGAVGRNGRHGGDSFCRLEQEPIRCFKTTAFLLGPSISHPSPEDSAVQVCTTQDHKISENMRLGRGRRQGWKTNFILTASS